MQEEAEVLMADTHLLVGVGRQWQENRLQRHFLPCSEHMEKVDWGGEGSPPDSAESG